MVRDPKRRAPLTEYLKLQGRFQTVLKDPEKLKGLQREIDEMWEWIALLEKGLAPRP
jgi:pyruvate ferredoxin oxidoreductase beta subunit